MMDLYVHSKKPEKSPRALGYSIVFGLTNARLGRVAQATLALDAMKTLPNARLCAEKLAEEISNYSSVDRKDGSAKEVVASIEDAKNSAAGLQSSLFSRMSPAEVKAFIALAKVQRLKPGDHIFKEGDRSNSLFVVASGELELSSSEGMSFKYTEGDFFGEIALLTPCERTGSVKALSEADLLEFSRDQVIQSFVDFPGLETKLAELFHLRLFLNLSMNHLFFKAFSEDRRRDFFYLCRSHRVPPKTLIIEEGKQSSHFFFMLDGVADAYRDGKKLGNIIKGEFFGESGFLFKTQRTASVLTSTPCDYLDCPDYLYDDLLMRFPELRYWMEKSVKMRESLGSD